MIESRVRERFGNACRQSYWAIALWGDAWMESGDAITGNRAGLFKVYAQCISMN